MSDSQPFLLGDVRAWSKGDSVEWINVHATPLFADHLRWPDRDKKTRRVEPAHGHLKGGYGKWLAETPHFPGLFELIHGLVLNWQGGAKVPTGAEVLAELERIWKEREGQGRLL